jgi:hypothetical protein
MSSCGEMVKLELWHGLDESSKLSSEQKLVAKQRGNSPFGTWRRGIIASTIS